MAPRSLYVVWAAAAALTCFAALVLSQEQPEDVPPNRGGGFDFAYFDRRQESQNNFGRNRDPNPFRNQDRFGNRGQSNDPFQRGRPEDDL